MAKVGVLFQEACGERLWLREKKKLRKIKWKLKCIFGIRKKKIKHLSVDEAQTHWGPQNGNQTCATKSDSPTLCPL